MVTHPIGTRQAGSVLPGFAAAVRVRVSAAHSPLAENFGDDLDGNYFYSVPGSRM